MMNKVKLIVEKKLFLMRNFVIYKKSKENQMLTNKWKTQNIQIYKMNMKKSNNY